MIGFRDRRILHVLALIGVLLALEFPPLGSFSLSGAAARQATPAPESDAPLYIIAKGEGSTPANGSELVWMVQRGAAFGEQHTDVGAFPLGFALAQRGALAILNANGTRIAELSPGRATFLPIGEEGSLVSASGDLALFVQIALVPAPDFSDVPPRGAVASEPFPTPGGDGLSLELERGILNPDRGADVPAGGSPSLLLAGDNAIQIAMANGEAAELSGGETALLTERVTVRNLGQQPATFVIARVSLVPTDRAAAAPAMDGTDTRPAAEPSVDPELDDAWYRIGCHLNPGNPSCLTVAVAAECAIDPADPGCNADRDGDSCTDVAEVRAGFDAYDPADCIGSAAGQPAVNCLFLSGNLPCNGDRIATSDGNGWAVVADPERARNSSGVSGRGES